MIPLFKRVMVLKVCTSSYLNKATPIYTLETLSANTIRFERVLNITLEYSIRNSGSCVIATQVSFCVIILQLFDISVRVSFENSILHMIYVFLPRM